MLYFLWTVSWDEGNEYGILDLFLYNYYFATHCAMQRVRVHELAAFISFFPCGVPEACCQIYHFVGKHELKVITHGRIAMEEDRVAVGWHSR